EAGPRGDLGADLESPAHLASASVDAVKGAVLVPGVDGAVMPGDRGLERADFDLTFLARLRVEEREGAVAPFLAAGLQVEGMKVLIIGADVDGAARDGRGALDRVARRELPAHSQAIGQSRGGNAGLQRIAAE